MTGSTELKAIEIGTTNRVYCSSQECAMFIPPYLIVGPIVACPKCSQRTGAECKCSAHDGACDAALELQVLGVAEAEGWRRCYQCRSMVELTTGCNHIT